FAARGGAEMVLQPRIAFGQLLERDILGDARARDAGRAIPPPGGFEWHRDLLAAGVNAEAVAPVDHHAFARGCAAFAAVIGPCHVDARLVQRCDRRPAAMLLPRATAPANA